MTRLYKLFGITIASPLALPAPIVWTKAAPDVVLQAGSKATFAGLPGDGSPRTTAPPWFLSRFLPDGTAYLRWTGAYEFLIPPHGRGIWYHAFDGPSPDPFNAQILGQVLSFSLLAFGHEPLHATVVARGTRAVALFGECGDGKSTLAASLLSRGCRLVTDDVMVTERSGAGHWVVHPGVPRIKVFPAVASRLLGGVRGTPMNGATSKLVVPLPARQTIGTPARLQSVYVLPASDSRSQSRHPKAEPLGGREAFLEIVRAAFNLQVVTRDRQSNQFAFAANLARDVPVHRLTYRRSFATLPAVADLVLTGLL